MDSMKDRLEQEMLSERKRQEERLAIDKAIEEQFLLDALEQEKGDMMEAEFPRGMLFSEELGEKYICWKSMIGGFPSGIYKLWERDFVSFALALIANAEEMKLPDGMSAKEFLEDGEDVTWFIDGLVFNADEAIAAGIHLIQQALKSKAEKEAILATKEGK